jgi:hypothetical protein
MSNSKLITISLLDDDARLQGTVSALRKCVYIVNVCGLPRRNVYLIWNNQVNYGLLCPGTKLEGIINSQGLKIDRYVDSQVMGVGWK